MSRLAPSLFAISVVFGGMAGMSAASLFGIDAGGGFIVGSSLLFVILLVASIISRDIEALAVVNLMKNEGSAKPARRTTREAVEIFDALRGAVGDGDKARRT